MAPSMTNVAAGRVNRRFLLVALLLGILSAGFIYVRLSQSGGEETPAEDVRVVVAKADIPRFTEIKAEMVEVKNLSPGSVPLGALDSTSDAVGKFALSEIKAKETVLASKLASPTEPQDHTLANAVERGERGVAITVDRVTTAGGLILPGDQVDVMWKPSEELPAYILFSNVEVTAVEQVVISVSPTGEVVAVDGEAPGSAPEDDRRGREPADEAAVQADAVTITLSLSPEESKALFCANLQGTIRLTVRAATDNDSVELDAPECPAPLPDEESEAGAQ